MTNRFLISVAAAALIAGTGFANAQGTGMSREGGSSAGSTMQERAVVGRVCCGPDGPRIRLNQNPLRRPSPRRA